jgi:polyvinyl alcohol dehydrogenase (cytochrome)
MTLGAALITAIAAGVAIHGQHSATTWQMAGNDLTNSRSQNSENTIKSSNVSTLATKWIFTTQGNVSATPTVDSTAVYVPDWAGNLFAVSRSDGQLIWSHQISQYDGFSGAISRTSPAISGADLIIGDIESPGKVHSGANVIAINRQSGFLHWITQVDQHPAAIITGSPVVSGNTVIVGVSSNEEGLADQPGYPCCTFRGSVVALDATTGKMLWQTYMLPVNGGQTGGYSGNAIWQPAAIDAANGLVYIGTGNNYSVPQSAADCQAGVSAGKNGSCFDPGDYFDSELALDIHSGAIRWTKQLQGSDIWTVACSNAMPGVTCPSPAGPDFDLGGSGPNLLPKMLAVGQKSGVLWGLDPVSGAVRWGALVGPGSTLGGIEWGTATDGTRIFAAIANSLHDSYALANSGTAISWGSWAAVNAQTGSIEWQTADPTSGAIDTGAMSVANGVVYAGSYSGFMYAMDAQTGKILWSFDSGGSVIDGPSIADGVVYWGSGYSNIKPGKANNKLYAFAPGSNKGQNGQGQNGQ